MSRRGRPQKPIYVNPYRPETLVAFACRVAISSRFEALADFAAECGWTNHSATLSNLTRAHVEVLESTVNASARDLRPGWSHRKTSYLLSLYDSLLFPAPIPGKSLEGDPPSRFLFELSNSGVARSKPEILDRGRALRTFMNELRSVQQLDEPCFRGAPPIMAQELRTKGDIVRETVRDLCVIAVQPIGSGGFEATRMIAEAGVLALRAIRQNILEGAPASWRLVRVITTCLRFADHWPQYTDPTHPRHAATVRKVALELLFEIDEKNPPNEYRARSLWEEAIGCCPVGGPEEASLLERLRRRAIEGITAWGAAGNEESLLPVRERTVAAWMYVTRVARTEEWNPMSLLPLHERCSTQTLKGLRDFADELARSSSDRGIEYAADFIRAALGDIYWPAPPEHLVTALTQAREEFAHTAFRTDPSRFRAGTDPFWHETDEAKIVLDSLQTELPPNLDMTLAGPGLYTLCYLSLLTIDGVARRESLFTIDTSGLTKQAARVFRGVIERARSRDPIRYRWLIETATFALGRMYDTDHFHVLINLAGDPFIDDSIRVTAFHAIADMADSVREKDYREGSVRSAYEAVGTAFRALDPDPNDSDPHKFRVRSALYVIGMYRIDNDEFVDRLRDIRDRDPRYRAERERTTRALAQWAIDRVLLHRMAEEAWVRKVHDNPLVAPHDVEHQQRQPASRLRRVADPYESLRVLPDVEVPEWTLDFTAPTAVE